jgi:hypothetical protein
MKVTRALAPPTQTAKTVVAAAWLSTPITGGVHVNVTVHTDVGDCGEEIS